MSKDYKTVLVLLLIMASGFPLFVNNKVVDMVVFVYALAGLWFFRPPFGWVIKATVIFGLLMAVQTIYFGQFYIRTGIYQVILFCGAGVSAAILGEELLTLYVKLMRKIALIATLIFIPIFFFPGLAKFLIEYWPLPTQSQMAAYGFTSTSHNLFFIHFPPDFFYGLIRNSGPFWEPGAFGGFLVIAVIINSFLHNTLFRKENFIFVIAILTTFSTTAYLALVFFVAGFQFFRMNSKLLKWGGLAAFVIIGLLMYSKLDFLGRKISREFTEMHYTAFVRGGDTRMASAYLDLKEITESPMYILFGRGSHPDTRIRGLDKQVLRTNGITDLLTRFGLVFFVFALFSIYASFRLIAALGNANKRLALVALGTMLILSFSEIYFIYIFFKVLILFHFAVPGAWRKIAGAQGEGRNNGPQQATTMGLFTGLSGFSRA